MIVFYSYAAVRPESYGDIYGNGLAKFGQWWRSLSNEPYDFHCLLKVWVELLWLNSVKLTAKRTICYWVHSKLVKSNTKIFTPQLLCQNIAIKIFQFSVSNPVSLLFNMLIYHLKPMSDASASSKDLFTTMSCIK